MGQVKSNKFICICILTGKIQQIDMNFCSDVKIQTNLIEFVFRQRKSDQYLQVIYGIFSNQIDPCTKNMTQVN